MKQVLIVCVLSMFLAVACNKNSSILVEDSSNDSLTEKKQESVTEEISSSDVKYETQSMQQIKKINIDLSNVYEMYTDGQRVKAYDWKIISEESKGYEDADVWYKNEKMSLPMIGDDWNHFYDEKYEYQYQGSLFIYDKESEEELYVLDYETDRWYVCGNNACLKDGIFYGASMTRDYAQPNTCFMFAYDVVNDKLLWRSQDQTYNSMNFVIVEDVIVCGYGFTSEKDYLYQINRYTGEVISRLELKKQPDLLVEKDGLLFVHAYDHSYVIELE